MSIGTTNVPIQADRPYVKAIKALAYQRGITMAELVRQALDRTYGDQLKSHLAFFYAQTGSDSVQMDTKKSGAAK